MLHCLAAGLDGIKNKLEVPASVDCNIFEMTEEERKDAGIEILPDNLYDAIKYLNEDKFICGVLGEHITTKYTEAKLKEWMITRLRLHSGSSMNIFISFNYTRLELCLH